MTGQTESRTAGTKTFYFNPFHECTVLIWDKSGAGVIVDPGFADKGEAGEFMDFIESHGIRPEKVLLTHGHFDHIYGVETCVEAYGIKVYMHPADRSLVENAHLLCAPFGMPRPGTSFETCDVKGGDVLTAGELSFTVIETPGHTPGGVCYYDEADSRLICGDTLFAGSIGRTDTPGGDYDVLMTSIMDSLMTLPGEVEVIPGHGPRTTIADERTRNPFLQPFNEPFDDSFTEL